MTEKFVIVIDLGTNSNKAGVVSLDGEIISKVSKESQLTYPAPGLVEQDPQTMYQASLEIISSALEKSKVSKKQIAAIGVTGQMAGIMGIDKNWNPVTHYDSWLDNRCKPYIKEIKEKGNKEYINTCGMPVTISHAAKMLWWKKERPKAYDKIHKFILPAAYVAGRLANLDGDEAFVDHSYLHFTGMVDAEKMEWSKKLSDLLEIPIEKMPKIINPWDVIGELTQKEADKCGLQAGIPIIAGAGDTAASFFGTGLTEPGELIDVAGTASVLGGCVEDFRPDVENETMIFPRAINTDYWYPLSFVGGGGLCLRWFRDTFAQKEKEIAKKRDIDPYELLNERASKLPPGSDGILFIPHLAGRTFPSNSSVKGSWTGFSWNHKKEHFYRAILESIAFEYNYYLDIIKKLFPEMTFTQVRGVGGGSCSDLWNQIKADVLGIEYLKVDEEDVGLKGLAIIAAKGVGLIYNMEEKINKIVKTTTTYQPRQKYVKVYEEYTNIYNQMISDLNSTFTKLDQISDI